MSFGTGEHSTTRLCLEILESQINRGDSVFDFGSGTSLLSIAAAKLGAGKVLAAD
jgi:ribosomal protein L11 methyltransferase